MIQLYSPQCSGYTVTPTIFPDKTSQVWKLPENVVTGKNLRIHWEFENERELVDILSVNKILRAKNPDAFISLHVSYLPFARQDKEVSNETTFNLAVFADIINTAKFSRVVAVDVHSEVAKELINNFENAQINNHQIAFGHHNYNYVVYPDVGAYRRYRSKIDSDKNIICYKERNQLTGEIVNQTFTFEDKTCGIKLQFANLASILGAGDNLLIVDDICDGGATFVGIAEKLKKINKDLVIHLSVTHGLFTKGKEVLKNAGISGIFYTNEENIDGR